MLFNSSRLFYNSYHLNKANGNFQLKITSEQLIYQFGDTIAKVFPIFHQLPHRFKLNFCLRILKFLKQYAFVVKENALLDNTIKVAIAASYVKLTLGYSHYLINAFDKIIVYPTAKYFAHLDETHKGHFNPKLKVIMFALDEFDNEIYYNNNGKDIAVHEFTHALCFEMLQRNANHPNANQFKKGFRLINDWMRVPQNKERIIQTEFLRSYALSNKLELVSVLVELFFEKEDVFKNHFPDLFIYVGKMIKHPKVK